MYVLELEYTMAQNTVEQVWAMWVALSLGHFGCGGVVQDVSSHVVEGVWLDALWDPACMCHHHLL